MKVILSIVLAGIMFLAPPADAAQFSPSFVNNPIITLTDTLNKLAGSTEHWHEKSVKRRSKGKRRSISIGWFGSSGSKSHHRSSSHHSSDKKCIEEKAPDGTIIKDCKSDWDEYKPVIVWGSVLSVLTFGFIFYRRKKRK